MERSARHLFYETLGTIKRKASIGHYTKSKKTEGFEYGKT